jgi:hypothetical protein
VLDCPPHEAGRGFGSLVGVLLDLGVARAIVDAGVQEGVAELGAALAALGRTTLHAVARTMEASEASGIDVKQSSRARPFIAAVGLVG